MPAGLYTGRCPVDTHWIAKRVQSGMHRHPVYIPTGEIPELRALRSRRRLLKASTTAGGPVPGRTCGRRAAPRRARRGGRGAARWEPV